VGLKVEAIGYKWLSAVVRARRIKLSRSFNFINQTKPSGSSGLTGIKYSAAIPKRSLPFIQTLKVQYGYQIKID
jgi:hypothetical protein